MADIHPPHSRQGIDTSGDPALRDGQPVQSPAAGGPEA